MDQVPLNLPKALYPIPLSPVSHLPYLVRVGPN